MLDSVVNRENNVHTWNHFTGLIVTVDEKHCVNLKAAKGRKQMGLKRQRNLISKMMKEITNCKQQHALPAD